MWKSNFNNAELNLCLEESKLSMKCLENNAYIRENCVAFFENYKECRKFWGKVIRGRKKAGIVPIVPTQEERQRIMNQRKQGKDIIQG